MTVQVSLVPAEEVFNVWPDVEPILKRATDRSSGRYETEDLLDEIFAGVSQLWIAFKVNGEAKVIAAATTKQLFYPRKKYLGITFCAGDELKSWQGQLLESMEHFAFHHCGCDAIEVVGREGWVPNLKSFGYKPGPASRILEKELSHG